MQLRTAQVLGLQHAFTMRSHKHISGTTWGLCEFISQDSKWVLARLVPIIQLCPASVHSV